MHDTLVIAHAFGAGSTISENLWCVFFLSVFFMIVWGFMWGILRLARRTKNITRSKLQAIVDRAAALPSELDEPIITVNLRTYTQFGIWSHRTAGEYKLPAGQAKYALDAALKHNLTWGLLTLQVHCVMMSVIDHWKQSKRIAHKRRRGFVPVRPPQLRSDEANSTTL